MSRPSATVSSAKLSTKVWRAPACSTACAARNSWAGKVTRTRSMNAAMPRISSSLMTPRNAGISAPARPSAMTRARSSRVRVCLKPRVNRSGARAPLKTIPWQDSQCSRERRKFASSHNHAQLPEALKRYSTQPAQAWPVSQTCRCAACSCPAACRLCASVLEVWFSTLNTGPSVHNTAWVNSFEARNSTARALSRKSITAGASGRIPKNTSSNGRLAASGSDSA